MILARANAKQGSRGWQLAHQQAQARIHARAPGAHKIRITVETKETALIQGRWNHIVATYSGSGQGGGMKLYVDGQPQDLKVVKDKLDGTVRTSAPMTLRAHISG